MSKPTKVNSPRRIRKGEPGYGKKKFGVLASENGKTRTIRYGDENIKIRKSNPAARKSFRARNKCGEKKSKLTGGYWSCKKW